MSQVMSIRAGRKNVGDVAYDNYIGQIAPADISAIVWYGVGGDDTTGDGSFANPYLTFARAILDVSATKIYVLETSLNGKYELTNKIYWDPTRPDDTGNGLTPATAKKTYAAAKTAAGVNGFNVIEAIGTFTMTDYLDFPVQGEVGEILTYSGDADVIIDATDTLNNYRFYRAFRTSTGTTIRLGNLSAGATPRIDRSVDGGVTWPLTGLGPWGAGGLVNDGADNGAGVQIIVGSKPGGGNAILRSVNDGVSWTEQAVAGGTVDHRCCVWTGTNFVTAGIEPGGARRIYTSPTGLVWTSRTPDAAVAGTQFRAMATDGAGNVMLVGRTNATTAYMAYSTDHGVTWTNYSALVGVGINTGGQICMGVTYNAGKWWIIQDTISPAIYYSTTPTVGAWASFADVMQIPDTLGFPNQYTWSTFLNGILYVPTGLLDTNIYLIQDSGVSIFNTTLNTEHHNNGVFSYEHGGEPYTLLLGRQGVAPNAGFTKRIALRGANIRANITNAVMDVAKKAEFAPTVEGAQFTAMPTAGVAVEAQYDAALSRSWIESADNDAVIAFGNKFAFRESVAVSDFDALVVEGAAAVAADIDVDRSIIDGGYDLNNAGGTNLERCRDTIITGNFTAEAVTSMESGNVQGAVANVSLAPIVTAIDPLFIGSQYKLQRELIPPSVFDSYMVAQSTFYTNGMAVARDLGAWSGIEVNKETIYLREFAFLLPAKSDAVASIKHNRVNLWVSETGVPDVVNTPDGAWEELLMTYGSLPTQEFGRLKNHLEFLDWLETLTDMTVELRLDPNYTPSTSITTGAAAAVDQPFIVVGSGTVKSGYRITIAGKTYSVGLVSGVYAVLDRGLEDAVLNGATLEVASIIGYGTYQYIPQTDRRLTRWAHDRTDFMRGFILRFARKWV
jgi:hypothetical protein